MLGGIALWNVLTGIVTSESGRELFRHAEEESSGLCRGVLEAQLNVFSIVRRLQMERGIYDDYGREAVQWT